MANTGDGDGPEPPQLEAAKLQETLHSAANAMQDEALQNGYNLREFVLHGSMKKISFEIDESHLRRFEHSASEPWWFGVVLSCAGVAAGTFPAASVCLSLIFDPTTRPKVSLDQFLSLVIGSVATVTAIIFLVVVWKQKKEKVGDICREIRNQPPI